MGFFSRFLDYKNVTKSCKALMENKGFFYHKIFIAFVLLLHYLCLILKNHKIRKFSNDFSQFIVSILVFLKEISKFI